jgi:tyrosine-protein kinase Etk/Wzc
MSSAGNDTIDLRAILRKVMAMWWLFLATVLVAMGVAVWWLKTTPKQYDVYGVMLMSDQKRNSFGGGAPEFLKGTSYLRENNELEDEVSVLMSFTNVLNTVQQLDFGIAYYEQRNFLDRELYEYKPFISAFGHGSAGFRGARAHHTGPGSRQLPRDGQG